MPIWQSMTGLKNSTGTHKQLREDKVMSTVYPAGNFKLTVMVGKTEVPAHPGSMSRDAARRLKKVWASARPGAQTRVRKAV